LAAGANVSDPREWARKGRRAARIRSSATAMLSHRTATRARRARFGAASGSRAKSRP